MRQGAASVAIVLAALALLLAGCAKRTALPEATPSAGATEAASAAPAESPAPGASAATQAEAAPSATPTGPENLLSMARGTIVREWPPVDRLDQVNGLVQNSPWQSKQGSSGPFVFVFEFAAPAEIHSLGFVGNGSNPDDPHVAQSVKVEGSPQGADGGYTTIGDYSLKNTGEEQTFQLASPVTVRWLRMTIAQRASDYTSLESVAAYGKVQTLQPVSLAGLWLEDTGSIDDPLYSTGKLVAPDPTLVTKNINGINGVQIVQQGNDIRAGRCLPTYFYVGNTWRGTQNGPAVDWADAGGSAPVPQSIVNAEGTMMVGPSNMMFRLTTKLSCLDVEPPTGSGKSVLVLTVDGRQSFYYPASHADQFSGFRFSGLAVSLLTADSLSKADSVVMYCVDKADDRLAPWQAKALLDFVSAGHAMIIYDADKCNAPLAYNFLPYPFKTANPGAQGAGGRNLFLVESDTLGSSDKNDAQHFYDPAAYVADPNNQIGDANTVTTSDPHWCGHLFGTNALNVNGFMQMYAVYGRGLIIYDGFDQDNASMDHLTRLASLELNQPVPAALPCSALVAGKFVIEPSTTVPFVAGKNAMVKVPMQVLANQGYAGNVSVSAKPLTDASWKAEVSPAQVALQGGVAPVNLAVSVPAKSQPGAYQFLVSGDDGQGHTASAAVILLAQPPPKVVKVKPVTKGCTEKLTIGADALFAFGEATLTPVAQKTLAGLGPTIKSAGKHPVRINGYTDAIGSDEYNQALSEQRARTVRDWLAAHGYVKASTQIQGFGKKSPVAPNTKPDGSDNPEGRAKNRRVEVLIDTCR